MMLGRIFYLSVCLLIGISTHSWSSQGSRSSRPHLFTSSHVKRMQTILERLSSDDKEENNNLPSPTLVVTVEPPTTSYPPIQYGGLSSSSRHLSTPDAPPYSPEPVDPPRLLPTSVQPSNNPPRIAAHTPKRLSCTRRRLSIITCASYVLAMLAVGGLLIYNAVDIRTEPYCASVTGQCPPCPTNNLGNDVCPANYSSGLANACRQGNSPIIIATPTECSTGPRNCYAFDYDSALVLLQQPCSRL